MKRVGIIALLQESNTFVPERTSLRHFEQHVLLAGDAVRRRFNETAHEIGGFFTGLEQCGLQAVPIFAARALPGGMLTAGAFEQLLERMLSALERAGPLDGILAAPHGATVCESCADVDGRWLSLVREWAGARTPLIGTLDPHGNLSRQMTTACDAIIAYRTNPHVDQRERGIEAAQLMARVLTGEVRPAMAASFPPLAINIESQNPDELPCLPIYRRAARMRSLPNVLGASICLGFPYADVPEMGAAAIAIANGDLPQAQALADELGGELWNSRREFIPQLLSIESALQQAKRREGPVCLLDMGDNVGGGSSGNGVDLALALHEKQMPRSFICIFDPTAVEQAAYHRPGSRFRLTMGERAPHIAAAEQTTARRGFQAAVELLGLFEGKFRESEPRHGGFSEFDQGHTAVVRTVDSGLTIMLTSRRMVPWSLAQLRSCNLEPGNFHILVAKGVHAPIAAYREVCQRFLRVNTPGVTSADLSTFVYRHRRRPMFPFEENTVWTELPLLTSEAPA